MDGSSFAEYVPVDSSQFYIHHYQTNSRSLQDRMRLHPELTYQYAQSWAKVTHNTVADSDESLNFDLNSVPTPDPVQLFKHRIAAGMLDVSRK